MFLNNILKTFFSDESWQKLRDLKKYLNRKKKFKKYRFARPRDLWLSFKAFLKDELEVIDKLDYEKAEIWMSAYSPAQMTRFSACRKEPETVNWIETHVKPGDVFCDIGAHVGAYSFVAYAVADKNIAVYSFEPSIAPYRALLRNIKLNKCEREIFPFPVALDNKESFYPLLSLKLDDVIKMFGLKTPNHIKLDVDGAEWGVLQGAINTFKDSRLRSALIEVDEAEHPTRVYEFMKEAGFKLLSQHQRGRKGMPLYNCIFERN